MDPLKISKTAIYALAGKISKLELTPGERDLLLAIFAAAADRAQAANPPADNKGRLPGTQYHPPAAAETVTAAGLKRQLLEAYFPGATQDTDTKPWKMKIARPNGPGGPP